MAEKAESEQKPEKPKVTKKKKKESAKIKIIPKVKRTQVRNIGLDVKIPEKECDDKNCPFHGTLSVRGQMINGQVRSNKMDKTVVVEREYLQYIPKFERYEKRRSRYLAHNPPCLNASIGSEVTIIECRPLSKTVSFVVIERK